MTFELKHTDFNNNDFKVKDGLFKNFGGRYAAEPLMQSLIELEEEFEKAWNDDEFKKEFLFELQSYGGRPSELTFCKNASEDLGIKLYAKREDLNHTGSHKINNVVGQALLAKRLGKTKLIADTGAGQHGVATATAAAKYGFECDVYMGAVDVKRQALNVFRMNLLGAEVIEVTSGSATLKDAVNEGMRDWVRQVDTTHFCLGSVVGPHPFPTMVREFQRVIGLELKKQFESLSGKEHPDYIIACVGGGSNAMGSFFDYIDSPTKLIGVEAEGEGFASGKHASAIMNDTTGIVHGMESYFMINKDGQLDEAHSISAGLDYPGVGPEHAYFAKNNLATYKTATDLQALEGLQYLAKKEGLLVALESAHAMGYILDTVGKDIEPGSTVVLTLSGRGDKDVQQVKEFLDKSN